MPDKNKPKRTYEEVQAEINSKLKEKKAYQERIQVAIDHIKSDPKRAEKLKTFVDSKLGGSTDHHGYCIGSACYSLQEAKEILSYTSGTKLQDDITSGKLKGYNYDYDLNGVEKGDILQLNKKTEKGGRGAPYHNMLVQKVNKDESGNVKSLTYFGSQGSAESFDYHDIDSLRLNDFKKDKNFQIVKKEFVPNSLYKERDAVKPIVKAAKRNNLDYIPDEQIKYLGSNDESSDKTKNRQDHLNAMMGRKEELMKAYNISNSEYNDLVKVSAGIIDQESEYGTSGRYKAKNIPGVQFVGKLLTGDIKEAFDKGEYSSGPGQSKPKYFPSVAGKKFGITPESKESTLLTVLDRYTTQVPSNLKGTPAAMLKTANVYKGMSNDNNEYAKSVLDKAASFGLSNYDQSKASFNDIKNKERVKKQEVMQQSFAPVVKQENFVNVKKEPVVKFRNGGWLDGLEEGKTDQAPDVTNATEYVKGWYNSPMYSNILKNQNIDLGIKNPKRLERRVNQHKKYYNEENYNVTPSVVRNPEEYGTGYIDNKGKKQINLDKNFVESNRKLVNSLFAHELTHDNLMTVKDREYINKNTPEYNPALHKEDTYNKLTDPEEVRSQIHSIRQLSGENKIYDPLTQPFKKEYLDKVNESYNQGTKESENYNQLNRLRKYYSDDQITEMMNTISKSNSNDGKVYAKNGGWLDGLSSPNNVIEDNRGQWAHPGKVTKINSNQITMKGVNYPVLGVSDSGDTQMMNPGGEYNFKGKTVTEYPQKFQPGGFLNGVDKGTQVPDATATAKPVVNLNFAVTPAQKQLAAKNKRQAEVDMQVDHPEFYGNQNPLDKKAVKPYSVEDYKKGIKEPGLQTSMDPIDLVGTGVYKGLAKALGAKEVAQGVTKGIKGSKQSIDFSKYLTQEEAVAARANRLISQKNKTGWDEQLTPELEQRLSTAVKRHNPASDYPGEKLGANTMGRTATEISKDANLKGVPLNEANKARVAAHETGHYYSNSPAEGEEWLSHFNLDKLPYKTKVYLRGKHRSTNYANEIRERAAQLKDYIAQKNGIPLNQDFEITQVQLDDAIKNYVKNTGLDNTMSPMLNSLKNKKGLLKTMNKRPLGIVPLTIGTTALQQDKKSQGGWLDNLK